MKASTWVYDKGEWYYVSSYVAMLANDWVKDNGKWYYLASSGKMLRNTYTPDGYYVGNLGAWQ
ncbi:choline-binding protein A [Streptococcus pseudopneumoniae]|nr:choline-binding protein A [Streptococcus pseudopneumoniae]TMR75350.1 choline-binding protein A [Streptococcus pseudopneumoniae]